MAALPSISVSGLQDHSSVQEASSPTTESSLTFTDKSDSSDNSFEPIDNPRSLLSPQGAAEMDDSSMTNSRELTRHAELYMDEGMVEIQVQKTLYRVPAYALVRDSECFRTLLKDHRSTSESDPVHIDDDEVTSVDFERFLLLVYPRLIGDFAAKTCEEWTSILHLATKWGFTAIRDLAIKQVFPLASDIDRIVLGRKYGLDTWLLDAFISVCSRPEPLSLAEARRMSLEDVVRIGQGYAAIRLNAYIMESARARNTIRELVDATSQVVDPKETSDVETSPPAPINIIYTHGSLACEDGIIGHAETPLDHAVAPTIPLADGVLKFASLLSTCKEELKKAHDSWCRNGHHYEAQHIETQKLAAQLLKDSSASCVNNSVDLKYCIELLVNDGISNGEDPTSFSDVLAQVCQSILESTNTTIEATIEHRHFTGNALAAHYLYGMFHSDIMSWTQPDADYGYMPDANVFARQKKTIGFLRKLHNLGAVPDGLTTLFFQQMLAHRKKMTHVTQVTQLVDLLRLAGKVVDAPDAHTRAALDDVFIQLGHLRLNPRFHSVHKSISSLIESRQNGWSTPTSGNAFLAIVKPVLGEKISSKKAPRY